MERIKNRIIAISGEPVSGKGTTVKMLCEKLKKANYDEKNIHILSTGDEFRRMFKNIEEFIRYQDNPEKLKNFSNVEPLKTILRNNEYRKVLIDTITVLKQNGIDLSCFSITDANNLRELKGIRKIVDTIIDTSIVKLGDEISKCNRPDEIWILDSRLAFHNIPEAFAVRLTCNSSVAGKRLFEDKSRGNEDKYDSVENATQKREERKNGEVSRYKDKYGIDLSDEANYNMVIDTSYSTTDDISDTILYGLDKYLSGEYVAKKWASPKMFIPTQSIRDTYSGNLSVEDIAKSIGDDGYKMNREVKVVQADGIMYILQGHHRNFAVAELGKTLVPFVVVAKDDEKIAKKYIWDSESLYIDDEDISPKHDDEITQITARQYSKNAWKQYLYDHEGFFDDHDNKIMFSYNLIYPRIFDIISKENRFEGR